MNFFCIRGCKQIFYSKNYGSRKCHCLNLLIIFFSTFLVDYLAKSIITGFNSIQSLLKTYLYNWLHPNVLEKIMISKKLNILKFMQFFGNFLTLLENTVSIFRLIVQSKNPVFGIFSILAVTTCFLQKKSDGFWKVKFYRNILNFLSSYPIKCAV